MLDFPDSLLLAEQDNSNGLTHLADRVQQGPAAPCRKRKSSTMAGAEEAVTSPAGTSSEFHVNSQVHGQSQ